MDWPDWSRQTAIIVGTGPSAVLAPLDFARGNSRVFAIKSSYHLAPWADALYGIDKGWWLANKGAQGFQGQKFSPSPTICNMYQDVKLVRLKSFAKILTSEKGTIGCGLPTGGGNSGFQAINLAIQFGATRILLVGFEMTLKFGRHWLFDESGVAKANDARTESWRKALDDCAEQFRALGISVINCTNNSALQSYQKMPLLAALGLL